jgi:hypothetical protein
MPYIGNQPAPSNVTSGGIVDGTIVNADIASDAAIAASKISGIPTDFVSAASGGTFSGDINVGGELITESYNETYVSLSGTSPAVNCEAGNAFSLVLSGTTTFTFTNPPASGTAYSFSVEVIQDSGGSGHVVNWPTTVDWPAATAPTISTTASAKDIFVFYTRDGGTNWYGFTAGQALG